LVERHQRVLERLVAHRGPLVRVEQQPDGETDPVVRGPQGLCVVALQALDSRVQGTALVPAGHFPG
jgi:hypothetical protein